VLVVTKTAKVSVSVSGVGLGLDPAGLGLGLPGLGLGLSGLGLGLPGLDNISGSMSQMLSRIVQSLIFRWCLSYLSRLSHSNSTPIQSSGLLPSLQSSFRPGYSTETAVLRVLSNLLQVIDSGSGDVAALVLLDLSAASDILSIMPTCVGGYGSALD